MHDAIGAVQNDYSVEVTLIGRELDPHAVSTILGVDAAEAARTGDRHLNGHGEGTYEEGFWSYEVSSHDDVTECRDHQITCLIDLIEPHAGKLESAGVQKVYLYYTLSSFTGLMNIRFRPETLTRLGKLNVELFVSCFDCFNPRHPYWRQSPTLHDSES